MSNCIPPRRRVDRQRDDLPLRAVALYQPQTSRNLTAEDGREIIHNLAGFLKILREWKAREAALSGGAR